MRFAIFGAGAVGGYFGGRLAAAGEDVVFIARGKHLEALRKNGLTIKSINGNFRLNKVNATDNPKRVGEVDVVLVGVKAWQVPEAAEKMTPLVGEDTCVVPLQNGIDAPKQLASILGKERVLGGLCRIVSQVVSPGHIHHTAIEPFISFGELDNHYSERAEILLQAFLRAGVNAEVPADIYASMWQKFIFIAAISGVGAVTRSPVGVIRSLPETRELLETALHEGMAVAQGRGSSLLEDYFSKIMAFIDGMSPEATASMQRDIVDGLPSELASQNGAMVRIGLEIGIKTPVHTFIYHSLLPQELKARGKYPL
ncbi:MAG TPA: 2-dehydropantoate 2-reductase [Anaerolineae bacterium]|nr:2-dehydropantoate 2-reductase [Anaerolineae bacterium]